MAKKDSSASPVRGAFRVDKDVLAKTGLPDPGATPVGPEKKSKASEELLGAGKRLDELQEALYAEGVGGGNRSVLLVLQGMDTSGKGGTVRHVLGLVNPMGVRYAAFKKPTPAERRHHYLWRIRRQLPPRGAAAAGPYRRVRPVALRGHPGADGREIADRCRAAQALR